MEYPDLPQPAKCLPVTAVDRHQGNMTKMTKKVYIERIEDPRGLAKPAEVSRQGGSRLGLTFREDEENIIRAHSGNIQRTFKEHSGSIQGTFGKH